MNKKKYITPMVEINDIDSECYMLSTSPGGTLEGSTGGDNQGSGMEIDSKEREDWGNLW